MIKVFFTLAAVIAGAVVVITILAAIDRLLHRDWPFLLAGLVIWLVVRNSFRGRI